MVLEVLYEDNHCLAVNKPAPLLTQAPPGIASLATLARQYLKSRYHKPGRVYLGVPHRLDRAVSGVILLARTTKAAQRLSEQFATRKVSKVYWGLVQGTLEPGEVVWEDWLRKVDSQARVEIVLPETPGAQRAQLRAQVLAEGPEGTFVEFCPQSGRMHQIRIQSAARGNPIVGDLLYGATTPFGPPAATERERCIALHARRLTFLHPIRYEPVTVTAPLPAFWPSWLSHVRGT
ncbi:MAG: RluA family pseudouridine synthase [Gemmataceae bacterium]|nr:RluA family pseudouridine synthase [Gemmataceae bacterium]